MRIVPFIISAASTIALVVALNIQLPVNGGKTPRLGFFLSPSTGFWQNAEPVDEAFNANLKFDSLHGNAEVYFDERLVPHVFADNDADAFFIQGFLHAKFRLWQMEFETQAAAGRLSEIFGAEANGTNFLGVDKFFRRLGMVYGAENSLKEMEADEKTKTACDAYTAGVNAYIHSLDEAHYPFEFKLLDYKPEEWTNLKTALFLKYMSFDLAGFEEDFEKTNARSVFTKEQYEKLFPYGMDSLQPIVPDISNLINKGLGFPTPATVDSLYFNFKDSANVTDNIKPNKQDGSNNWAVDGSKTQSGRPILCNDPHLGLNLPSLWYEMQISTPNFNAYGATFPAAPAVIIGFNDSCAFGFTNSERDVRDYYEIKFKDSAMSSYWFDGDWQETSFRDEVIHVRGKVDDTEHIAMTIFGPVMYDKNYPDKLNSGKAYACRWKAHDASNELLTFLNLDAAKNFNDYQNAIATYKCPGQNMIFASKAGDIAIKPQGEFPAKWKGQGDFIMPGFDSSYMWQSIVPDSANIVMHNPTRGFVSSANQYPYDTKNYPYYLGGSTFELFRGYVINRNLSSMQNITTTDMQQLQNSNYNLLAEMARPVFLKYLRQDALSDTAKKYLDIFTGWNLQNNATETGPTVFRLWWDSLVALMYNDEFAQTTLPLPDIDESTVIESLIKDSTYEFADDISTPQIETLYDDVSNAFNKIVPQLQEQAKQNKLEWSSYKDAAIRHLLKIEPLSRMHVASAGGSHIINAYEKTSGPSWKMIVELTDDTNAYGIYPGGQSGNPGSIYYDNFINDYLAGKYYSLHIMPKQAMQNQPGLKGKLTFSKS